VLRRTAHGGGDCILTAQLTLPPGTRLGVYDITALIGEGGMGQVYRATDTRLKRQVAIKVLPPSLAADQDRLKRFQREAEVLASLNHPNIAQIHGVEESGGVTSLVMELVEGDDLSQRLTRGAIPVDEALPIARQIAEALEAAHEHGVIHRDLKPANVKVRADGTVKVLDFGLAKAMESATDSSPGVAMSPTFTTPAMTQAGVILGTAAYMSPEQAKGRVVDKRSDIWAFGVLLFEMLTGHRAFKGDGVSETLAAVLKDTPQFAALPASTPSRLRTLIERCLERDVKLRLRDIGEARVEIARLEAGGVDAAASPPNAGRVVPRWRRALPWGVAAVLAVALAASLSIAIRPPQTTAPLRRFTLAVPSKVAPNWNDFSVAISPDGAKLAYNCRQGNSVSICLRALDSLESHRLVEGRDAYEWFFSPDGEWLGIVDEAGLSKVSVHGGQPQSIYRWPVTAAVPIGFSWGPDDFILFGTAAGVQRVAASGGSPEAVTRVGADGQVLAHTFPSHLPDGRHALVTIARAEGSSSAGVVDLKDGSVRDLGVRGEAFVFVAPGWLTFRQGTTVLAVAFDPANPGRPASPVPVIEGVSSVPRVARDGTLVYIPIRGESSARLVWVDREGRATPIGGERLDYTHLDLAPDGRRAALNLEGGSTDLIDLQGGTRKRLAQGAFPIFTSNGQRVIFRARGGLQWLSADGSAPAELLVSQDGYLVPTSWNGRTGELAYYDHRSFEIWIRGADGTSRRFLGAPGRKRSGRFSPDGKWLAFVSDETGDYQVYVTAYPGPGAVVPVSTRGGLSPIWSADGAELFFRLGTKMLAARMSKGPTLGFSAPVELFDGPYTLDLMGHQREDVASDGRFLMVENSDDFPIVIVQNWPMELGRVVR
jgi:eukaryotic-like serine/threonine-protein kinase